ncbi:MAG: dihydroorotate dehydrogenase electron transfer subunit [Candidatus Bathyarchaeota archaeon]|nr:dihydroorotate dehydrogenase electron transfer subunit [Candidatus Bathyarchaeota archaeon A05DMB-3]MDH7607535.1 dihydroorotate dehydrogenase electron transfer subunit [Candidatus Bathyarchaeota archaeon]
MKLSAWLTAANKHRTTRIMNVEVVSPTVKVFTFQDKQCAKAKPGQFLMLWVPGVDEIPLSVLDVDRERAKVSVAVKRVGEATKALHSMKAGDWIGMRGPFGNGFTLKRGKILMVGGGVGIAPLTFLAKNLASGKTSKIVVVIGAKTREELIFMDNLRRLCEEENVLAATEDGSYGVKGLASSLAESVMAEEKFNMVYTCGPEPMTRRVLDCAEKVGIYAEASLERLMRCAIGICGSCVVGGYRVCRDGPVFNINQLKTFKDEFGVWKRDFNGKRIPV